MKIASIVSNVTGASGGVGPVIVALHKQFVRHGHQDVIFTKASPEKPPEELTDDDLRMFVGGGPKFWGYAAGWSEMVRAFEPDIIHSHGLWQYCSYMAYKNSIRLNVPTIISPHGMLDEYALNISGWKKKIVRKVFENAHLNRASCIHALCESEFQSIRNCGITAPVTIIPNGVNLPDLTAKKKPQTRKHLLYLGRITPKKGLDQLLHAWKILQTIQPDCISDWQLDIVGWGQPAFVAEMRNLAHKLGVDNAIYFHGPAFGEQKASCFLNADGFILPSFSEGLPMTVLEAWAFAVPALITDQCNLPEGFSHHAAIRITPLPSELAATLADFFVMPEDYRLEIGRNGRALVEQQFSWDTIGQQMLAVYRWCQNNGEMPQHVKV